MTYLAVDTESQETLKIESENPTKELCECLALKAQAFIFVWLRLRSVSGHIAFIYVTITTIHMSWSSTNNLCEVLRARQLANNRKEDLWLRYVEEIQPGIQCSACHACQNQSSLPKRVKAGSEGDETKNISSVLQMSFQEVFIGCSIFIKFSISRPIGLLLFYGRSTKT